MESQKLPQKCFIIEKDVHDDIIWSWIFPKLSQDDKPLILKKIDLNRNDVAFTFFHFKGEWVYIKLNQVSDEKLFPLVTQVALGVSSAEYNPSKYQILSEALSRKYLNSGSPVEMQKLYLAVYTNESPESSFMKEFTSVETVGAIKELIQMFELEIILLYNAILLKRRVVIFHTNLGELYKWIKAVPDFVARRDPSDYLYPVFSLNHEDIFDLKSRKYFVAGTTENSIVAKNDFYDLLINIPAKKIKISPHSKEVFVMTKTHKEIAMHMLQLSQDISTSDHEIKKSISDKTEELINQLRQLGTVQTDNNEKMISLDYLRGKKLSPAIENFLFNLALAENIMLL